MSFFMPEVYAANGKKEKGPTPSGMDPFNLVRLAGIEPTTPWFVAKYSIQLSYSRKNCFSASLDSDGHNTYKNWCGWQESNPRPLGS